MRSLGHVGGAIGKLAGQQFGATPPKVVSPARSAGQKRGSRQTDDGLTRSAGAGRGPFVLYVWDVVRTVRNRGPEQTVDAIPCVTYTGVATSASAARAARRSVVRRPSGAQITRALPGGDDPIRMARRVAARRV